MKQFSLAAALVLLTAPAFAQDTTTLATKYVNMPEVQDMITNMFSPEALAAQVAASLPPSITLSNSKRSRIGVVMSKAMTDLRPRLEELMISGSAETFSTAELQALIGFYQSEHGATIMSKMTPFMTRTMGALAPEMQALQAKIGPSINQILQEQD